MANSFRLMACEHCGSKGRYSSKTWFTCLNCGKKSHVHIVTKEIEKPEQEIETEQDGDNLGEIKAKPPAEADNTCEECGAALKKGMKYCPGCGVGELEWPSSEQNQE